MHFASFSVYFILVFISQKIFKTFKVTKWKTKIFNKIKPIKGSENLNISG